jgi:hypothetical protein
VLYILPREGMTMEIHAMRGPCNTTRFQPFTLSLQLFDARSRMEFPMSEVKEASCSGQ